MVAKSWNYLLNMEPGPDGEWPDEAKIRMKETSFSGINIPAKSTIQLVDANQKLKWKKEGETTTVFLPKNGKALHAVAVKIILPKS